MKNPVSSKSPYIFPVSLVFFELAAYLSVDMYLPSMPRITSWFDTSEQWTKATLSSWLVGAGFFQLILGPISDKIGRRPVMIVGCIVFSVATLVCAMTESFWQFLIARFFQGTAICYALVAGYSCINESLSDKEAIKTLSWMNSITVLAPALGPVLGVVVLHYYPWQVIFYFLAGMAISALIFINKFMPETITKSIEKSLSIKRVSNSYLEIISNKSMMLIAMSFSTLFCMLISWNVSSPFFLITKDSANLKFALVQAYIFILFILGTRITNHLIDKKSPDEIIKIGFAISVTGIIFSLIFGGVAVQSIMSIAFLGLFTLGAGISFSPLFRKALGLSKSATGISIAVISSCMNLFAFVSSVLVSIIHVTSMFEYSLIAAPMLSISIAAYFLGANKRAISHEEREKCVTISK